MKRPATNAQRSDDDSGFCSSTQIHFYTIHIIHIYVYICVIVEQVFGRKFVFPWRLFPRGKNIFRLSPFTKRSLPSPSSSLIIGTYFPTMNYPLTWYFKFLPTRNFYRFDAFIATTLRLYYASILSLYAVYSIPLNNARRTMSIEIRVYYLRIYEFTYCRYILYYTLHLYNIYIRFIVPQPFRRRSTVIKHPCANSTLCYGTALNLVIPVLRMCNLNSLYYIVFKWQPSRRRYVVTLNIIYNIFVCRVYIVIGK